MSLHSGFCRLFLFVAGFTFGTVDTDAQTQDLRLRSAQELGAAQQKSIYSALVPMDPEVRFSFDGASVKVRIAQNVDLVALLNALDASGAGPFQRVLPPGTVAAKETLESFPAYIDTGNPLQDEADLAARKAAWALAHPEAHAVYLERVREALDLGLPLPE
jgi:hypothetical protein